MSGHRALQSSAAAAEESQRDEQPSTRRLHVGQSIAHVLTITELADLTGYSVRQISRFRAARNHPGIKQLDGPGHPRFCGRTLKAWLDGGACEPARRSYFGTAVGRRR